MHRSEATNSAVVVGIDGSRSAVNAALWAVDEAVSRDIPLRLVYAVDPDIRPETDAHAALRDFTAAESAIRFVCTAIESTDKPVKIEVEILQARPVRALVDASRSAALLCLGFAGLQNSCHGQAGSTAASVMVSAHCPVVMVHDFDPLLSGQRAIVVEVDDCGAGDGACLRGLDEARLRGAPLHIVTATGSKHREPCAASDGKQLAETELRRRLSHWIQRYPDVHIEVMATTGDIVDYLASESGAIQLVVVSRERHGGPRELVGPPGYAAVRKAGCSVLVCQSRSVL